MEFGRPVRTMAYHQIQSHNLAAPARAEKAEPLRPVARANQHQLVLAKGWFGITAGIAPRDTREALAATGSLVLRGQKLDQAAKPVQHRDHLPAPKEPLTRGRRQILEETQMQRQSVSSSDLRSVGYDAETQVLEIEFHSGGIYQYSRVPESISRGLLGAASKGRYFHAYVKDRYSYRRIR